MAIVFTAGDHSEGIDTILRVAGERKIEVAFFVTGNFLRQKPDDAKRILAAGHLLGPHSDQHLLYCPWDDRSKSLVSEAEFKADLEKNMADLRAIGVQTTLFMPPYEWFNRQHVKWASEMGLTLINFTPGSGSNRDYIPESDPKFLPSARLVDDILAYERRDPNGLNGFILLLHAGSLRKDKMHDQFDRLVDALQQRQYEIVRVDELLNLESSKTPRDLPATQP